MDACVEAKFEHIRWDRYHDDLRLCGQRKDLAEPLGEPLLSGFIPRTKHCGLPQAEHRTDSLAEDNESREDGCHTHFLVVTG
jgi:hypothetical protein